MRRNLCNGVYNCHDLSDECLCERETSENTNTFTKCEKIFDEMESVDKCTKGNISCRGTNSDICISLDQICDDVKDCADGWDEIFCQWSSHHRQTKNVTYFSCKQHDFQDLSSDDITNTTLYYANGTWLLIDWRRMFDGKADCPDIFDEWHENFVYCGKNRSSLQITRCKGADGRRLFASPSNAVDSIIFPIVEWFFGVFGVIGNSIVAFNTIVAIATRRKANRQSIRDNDDNSSHANASSVPGRDAGQVINHILVLFLCISDFVLSIQIVSMAAANEYFRGKFWRRDDIWQSSVACSVVGSMAIFSTQASSFMIVVISYVRLYAVSRPFKNLRVRCVVLACISTYVMAMILMVIPLSTYITAIDLYFTSSVQVPNAPQPDANVLERDTLESYVRKIVLLSQTSYETDFTEHSWEELERIVISINPNFGGWSYYGYYSFISVCIPPIVSHWSDPGLLYSFFLLVLDFVAFLLVFVAYYVVFRRTRRGKSSWFMAVGCCAKKRYTARQDVEINLNEEIPTRPRARSMTRDEEDYEMQKRILWIVGTDCLCWTPIFFLTLACMIDDDVQGSDTFLLAMFAVQINCVVNPLVYSRRVRRAIKRAGKTCASKVRYILTHICKRQYGSAYHVRNGNGHVLPNEIPISSLDTYIEDTTTSIETLEVTMTESDTI